MKKSIIKNLIALTFALGALVFVAGNVFADETVVSTVDLPEVVIECHANYEPVRNNKCWIERTRFLGHFGIPCQWTGKTTDKCLYW